MFGLHIRGLGQIVRIPDLEFPDLVALHRESPAGQAIERS